jgi:hypothetical protein
LQPNFGKEKLGISGKTIDPNSEALPRTPMILEANFEDEVPEARLEYRRRR